MLENFAYEVNAACGMVAGSLLNTAAITCSAVGLALLVSRGKRWSAASRCHLWWVMMAFVIALPIASALVPDAQPPNIRLVTIRTEPVPVPTVAVVEHEAIPEAPTLIPVRLSPLSWVLLCWMVAACLQLVRFCRGLVEALRLKRAAIPASEDLQAVLREMTLRLSMSRPVALSVSDRITLPAVVGYRKPHILIPAQLTGRLNMPEIEQILLHELAHLARYDDWSIAIQRLLETVGVFHPLIQYLSRRLSRDREMVCDDFVASVHEPQRYAACLAKAADLWQFSQSNAVLVPFLERKSELLERVEMLLDRTRTHVPNASVGRLAAVVSAGAVLAIAGLQTPKLMATPSAGTLSLFLPRQAAPPVPPEPVGPSSPPAPPTAPYTWKFMSDDGGAGSGSIVVTSQDGQITFTAHGKTYVIRDKTLVGEAEKLLQPMNELGRKQGELGQQQSKLGEQQSSLGWQQERLAQPTSGLSSEPARQLAQLDSLKALDSKQMENTLTNLEKQMKTLEGKFDLDSMQKQFDEETKAFDKLYKELDTKAMNESLRDTEKKLAELQPLLGRMQSDIGREQSKIAEEQSRFGDQQATLGEQQAELGRQQAELGRQQAERSREAKRKLEQLIREAQSHGLAQELH